MFYFCQTIIFIINNCIFTLLIYILHFKVIIYYISIMSSKVTKKPLTTPSAGTKKKAETLPPLAPQGAENNKAPVQEENKAGAKSALDQQMQNGGGNTAVATNVKISQELKPPGSALGEKSRNGAKTRDMSADVAIKKGKEEVKSKGGLPTINKVPAVRESSQEANAVSNPQLETDRTKNGGPTGKGLQIKEDPAKKAPNNKQGSFVNAPSQSFKNLMAEAMPSQNTMQPLSSGTQLKGSQSNVLTAKQDQQTISSQPPASQMQGGSKAKENSAGKGKIEEAALNKSQIDSSQLMQQKTPSKITSKSLFQTKDQPNAPSYNGPSKVTLTPGNCPYCLRKEINVIDIGCTHSYCSKCCMNLIKITRIKKGLNLEKIEGEHKPTTLNPNPLSVIKCAKCQQINMLSNKKIQEIHEVLEIDSHKFKAEEERRTGSRKDCQMCSNKNPQKAQFECLNCEYTLMCESCKVKHVKNPKYKGHKVLPIKSAQTGASEKIEEKQCPDHLQKYRLYCYSDDKPLCLKCTEEPQGPIDPMAAYELHSNHFVKSITDVLEGCEKEKEVLKSDIKNELDKIASACEYFAGVEEILMNQKDLQLRKLAADFEVINKLVERKHAELRDKIQSAYDKHLKDAYQYVEGLHAIKETIQTLEQRDIIIDIDQITLNKALTGRIKEIQTELDFELKDADMDIIESRFLFEPFQKIEKALMEFNFFPVQNSQLHHLEAMFQISQKSKIITSDIMTPEFLLICLPPKLASATMLYQYTKEVKRKTIVNGGGAQRFHAKCDNMGPTLVFVKANSGHIFGGFNPTSWISDFMYSEAEDAYLFSVTDGKGRKPIKCPVKPQKKDKAIKQNEKEYSPAFGEANISDLFIAFKNPSNSYSMLGNVFKLPKGYESETFLAGKHNEWVIEEIEVWAVQF